jgi:hypothetical protein
MNILPSGPIVFHLEQPSQRDPFPHAVEEYMAKIIYMQR